MSSYTRQGIKCANCKTYHPTVADVRDCHLEAERDQLEAEYEAQQARAEWEADQANERSFEDRGYWEDQAFEQWERSQGVVDFGEALAAANRDAEAFLIEQIRSYAANHYEEGWDVIVEAYDNERLIQTLGADFGPAMSLAAALEILRPYAETWLDVSQQRRAAAGWDW